ncbi:unnamed protein product [Rotaria sp. Silwood2]|nr:unnamed protein product [Rotaria sp. Silwood2]
MSTTASRYADYSSACPRCQQIINTIDITFQQGIFIYDLTFIQQELESVLVAALQRQKQLLQSDGENLTLPLSSMIQLTNGKKPRDFKAERERKRKAFSGQISRKRRRRKKPSNIHLLKPIKRERNQNNLLTIKQNFLHRKSNENSTRPIRSYRPINFTYPFYYETNYRNNNHNISTNKLQLNNVTFPSKYAELQHRLTESINLERLALDRAEKQYKLDSILIELNELDDKILEITNSIRQRKRPSESAISLCKLTNPINNNHNHQQNGNNDNDAWRKGRRQSTLRIYDELARLVDERINIEKQLIDIIPSVEL